MSCAATSIDLKQFVPDKSTDPVAYVLGTQYDHIRCRLFHAKVEPPAADLDVPNPEEVTIAYERLLRLWREIAIRCLSVRSSGGGVVTYVGFKMMLDNALADQLKMYFTDDASPAKKEDTEVSPTGRPVFPFANATYLSETAPGRVSFIGSHPLADIAVMPAVHRICSGVSDGLMTAYSIAEGLYPDGVDYFESHQTIRLINNDLPRVTFGEDS
jgi:hypothetical protein